MTLIKKVSIGIVATLLVLLSAQMAFAYTVPDCITLGDFEVCFQGVTENNDGTYTWYYSIEGTGGDDGTFGQELSHWTLGLCSGYTVEEPQGTFETLAEFNGVTSDEAGSTYEVEVGKDPSTPANVDGIKYNATGEQLGDGDVHIFSFTTSSSNTRVGDTQVVAKWGGGAEDGIITGPVCSPTAATMATLSADSGAAFEYSAITLFGLIALVPATFAIRRLH